jgi:hypothetical protein
MLCSLYCSWQQITPSSGLMQKFVMCSYLFISMSFHNRMISCPNLC